MFKSMDSKIFSALFDDLPQRGLLIEDGKWQPTSKIFAYGMPLFTCQGAVALESGGHNASRETTRCAEITAPMFEHIFTGIRQGQDQDATLEA